MSVDPRTSVWSTAWTVFAFSCFTYAIVTNHGRKAGLGGVLSGDRLPGQLFVAPGSSAAPGDGAAAVDSNNDLPDSPKLPLYRVRLAAQPTEPKPATGMMATDEQEACDLNEANARERGALVGTVQPAIKCQDLHREAFLDADKDQNGILDTTEFYAWWLRSCKQPDGQVITHDN